MILCYRASTTQHRSDWDQMLAQVSLAACYESTIRYLSSVTDFHGMLSGSRLVFCLGFTMSVPIWWRFLSLVIRLLSPPVHLKLEAGALLTFHRRGLRHM